MYRLGLPRTAMAASFDFIVVSKTKSVVISDGWQSCSETLLVSKTCVN